MSYISNKCLSLFAFSVFIAIPAFAEDVKLAGSTPNEEIVRTPKDLEQGKKNVQGVAEQLRAMFNPIDKTSRKKKSAAAYSKIVKIDDETSALFYRFRYSTASKMLNSVEAMVSETGYVEYSEEQNLLTIRDSSANIQAIAEALPSLDVASSQVLIEAKIIEVMLTDNAQRHLSFSFNSPTTVSMIDSSNNQRYDGDVMSSAGATTSPFSTNTTDGGRANWTFASGHNNFNVALQWLLTAQDARVLSSPVIVVARNEEAKISNGQDVPIQSQTITNGSISTSTTFKRVGVTLNVQPLMINDDNVTLMVEPEVSNIQSYQTITVSNGGSYQVPVVSIRSISSYLRLADGQIVIMGGLYNDRVSVQQQRTPFLSDIPYLGELFTSKFTEKEIVQLLFFLRVRILNEDDLADGVLFDPEEVISSSEEIGNIVRNSQYMPKLDSSVEKVKNEFIDNPLVTWESVKKFFSEEDSKASEQKDGVGKDSAENKAVSEPETNGNSKASL